MGRAVSWANFQFPTYFERQHLAHFCFGPHHNLLRVPAEEFQKDWPSDFLFLIFEPDWTIDLELFYKRNLEKVFHFCLNLCSWSNHFSILFYYIWQWYRSHLHASFSWFRIESISIEFDKKDRKNWLVPPYVDINLHNSERCLSKDKLLLATRVWFSGGLPLPRSTSLGIIPFLLLPILILHLARK